MSPIVRTALLTVLFLLLGTGAFLWKEYVVYVVPLSLALLVSVSGKLYYHFGAEALIDPEDHALVYYLSCFLFGLFAFLETKDVRVFGIAIYSCFLIVPIRSYYHALKPYLEETEV